MKVMSVCVTACGAMLLLAACGKVAEKATEKVAEKAIEAQMAKEGVKANVNLAGSGGTVTTTDASGKTSKLEWGSAQLTEAELGVPFYPGTQPRQGAATRIDTPQGQAMTVSLQSGDAADKVAAFYRDKLKAMAEGKQLMDMNMGDGQTTLMLADKMGGNSTQIHIAKAGAGSEINIVVHRGAAK